MRKIIVVSAVNLVEGGPLTILHNCLEYLSINLVNKYEIIALVNRKELCPFESIKCLEFPKSKKAWLNRLYYEYYYFNKLSKRLKPLLWLSLHDITPRVMSDRLAVYCHNASPFYKANFHVFQLDPKFMLFNLFYQFLYSININRNMYVIVQQDWMRQEFIKRFRLKNVIVAHPEYTDNFDTFSLNKSDLFTFIYPAFPRVFKNFDVICSAAERLYLKGISNFKIILTIDGSENKYSRSIYKQFKHLPVLCFVGLQPKNKILEYYRISDCLIFPSKLETWGLPITEFKKYDKPILLANLPYARETVGKYSKVKFFSSDNSEELACSMESLINKTLEFDPVHAGTIKQPYAQNWEQLFDILLSEQPDAVSVKDNC